MNEMNEQASAYWRDTLSRAGVSAIPRWTSTPVTGVKTYVVPIDGDLQASIDALSRQLNVSVESIVLASHAKVLGVLSGESELTTGLMPRGGSVPLPCVLSTESVSWAELIRDCEGVRVEIESHGDFPIGTLIGDSGYAKPSFDTTIALRPGAGEPTANLVDVAALSVAFVETDDDRAVHLTYRTEALDDAAIGRVGHYYLRALELMTSDPDSTHRGQSLLSVDELTVHLEDLAGPYRELPDVRFHEVFEQRARQHPDSIAAVFGDRQWSYAELNSRANQLARALQDRGAEAETVVAVVTERNLDWMASVIAIFKVGATYLPIEPHFPADRIASMIKRSECRIVITESQSTTTLLDAVFGLPNLALLFAPDAYDAGLSDADLGLEVGTSQLAYIYFTSGSTGEPKGAMCEQLGMLNHLYAKIDDFGISEGQNVAQIAPQCFDISLWQLVSAVMVGGSTVLIDQGTLLDPKRFVDLVLANDVAVLQVVPSYLEVLLTYLEDNPTDLGGLHCVSVTGEALTLELARRWFRSQPGIKLANAYGLTETCDDTNHEVMLQAPAGDRVPLGPAVNNVEVRVVDETLWPVPLGAPGEIVFGGICVGRGYINDPERTDAVFVQDPMFEGRRVYRSGDFGRWNADGKLEFLGRRDAQVKIRGFRIEIGDIENAMFEIEGVRQGSVVIVSNNDGNKQLVGFYSGDTITSEGVLTRLGAALPEYMVPSVVHQRDVLPLSDNGKIDRKVLRSLAHDLQTENLVYEAPVTDNEVRLAAIWSKILKVEATEIGRNDNFFDRGASSLSAVELVVALDREVSLKTVTQTPVLADLAALLGSDNESEAGLIQLLTQDEQAAAGSIICFPYAGGNSINFRALADTLGPSGLGVYAVELPGHDLTAERESFEPIADVAGRLVDEIVDHGLSDLLLWGQSSGTALVLEVALRLEARGVAVRRVFLGAQLLGTATDRQAHMSSLEALTNSDIADRLAQDGGYGELDKLQAEQADHVGAAYRHDCNEAHGYFVAHLTTPPTTRLRAPITAVVAADDTTMKGRIRSATDWQLFADVVDVVELSEGGHYFMRTRLKDTADVILGSLPVLSSAL